MRSPEDQAAWVDDLDDEQCRECLKDMALHLAKFNTIGFSYTDDQMNQMILGMCDILDQWGTNAEVNKHIRGDA